MRRLWSHIALAATSLLMVGATFASVMTSNKRNSNIEFEKGQEMVFRLNEKDDDKNIDLVSPVADENAAKDVAKIMESRLKTADVTRYKIETQGNDMIKVTFKQDSDKEYEIIKNYLTFDATLALSNSKESVAYAEEFLNPNKKAYLEITEGYPAIVIPIDKDNQAFKTVYEEAKEMSDNNEGEVEEEHSEDEETEEGEEHEHTRHAYLYLWYNYVKEYYSYSKIDRNNEDEYDETIASKILMTFDAADPFYDEDQDALRAYVRPTEADDEASITAAQLATAYQNARYYINLLNADSLDYYVTFLFSKTADVWVEDLIALGDKNETIAWSRTFIATLCAIVVVSLLLVYFYRLGALSIATTSIVSTFFGLLFIVLFSAEFNVAGIVGLVALAFTSIISGVIYMNKLKEECYRGRSLKKANTEAAKKALLPTIDVHVALVLIGVACYLLGGVLMKGFALATILGGLVSLVLNLAGLRGLMWLVTNEQGLANRYDLFDVSKDQVPNALEEEKQKYYGANADRDFTKHKKVAAIVSGALFLASVVGLIISGVANNGEVFGTANRNKANTNSNTQVYVEYSTYSDETDSLKLDTKQRLDDLLTYSSIDGKSLKEVVDVYEVTFTTRQETTKSGVESVNYAYYRLTFNKVLKDTDVISYNNTKDGVSYENVAPAEFFDKSNSDAIQSLGFNDSVKFDLRDSVRVSADQPEFKSLILATSVAAAAIALYLLLRYRLTRGLACLAMSVLSVGISAGVFALLGLFLPVASYVSVALPFVALFSFAIAVIFMNKEREMVLEDRSRDNSVENREKMMVRAVGISSTPITISFIMALYLGVNFFGFMVQPVSWVFLLIILGVIFATALTLVLMGPCAQLLFKWFSKVNIARPQLKKKKKAHPVRVKKSAEPEEAIFIGIND